MPRTEPLLSRIQAGNCRARTFGVEHALVIAELGHTRLGDTLQAISGLRYLKQHLGIRHLDINLPQHAEYLLGAQILASDPLIRRCTNLSYSEIRYTQYQLVLHYTLTNDSPIVALLAQDYDAFVAASPEGMAFYSLVASAWDLQNLHGEAWRGFVYALPLLDMPQGMLEHTGGNHRMYLDAQELAWAVQWLAQAGVGPNDVLIVFIDDASVPDKVMHPDCTLRVLEHLLSMGGVKVLLYDPHAAGKRDYYRTRLHERLFSRMIVSPKSTLRRDVALLGAPQVTMIVGPDTGMMHCASGLYAARIERNEIHEQALPSILVYAGGWGDFDMHGNWRHSLARCTVFFETDTGKALCPLEECPHNPAEFMQGLATVRELPAELMIDFIQNQYAARMRMPRAAADAGTSS